MSQLPSPLSFSDPPIPMRSQATSRPSPSRCGITLHHTYDDAVPKRYSTYNPHCYSDTLAAHCGSNQAFESRTMALSVTTSLRITAINAVLGLFPADSNRS